MLFIHRIVLALIVLATLGLSVSLQADEMGRSPSSFFLPKTEWDPPSWWTKISDTEYRETYAADSGIPDNILRVVGRARMNGASGTVVYRPEVKVFIPDLDSGSQWVGLHWNGEWKEKWRPITDVK